MMSVGDLFLIPFYIKTKIDIDRISPYNKLSIHWALWEILWRFFMEMDI